jgi:hypothetical protein
MSPRRFPGISSRKWARCAGLSFAVAGDQGIGVYFSVTKFPKKQHALKKKFTSKSNKSKKEEKKGT